VHLRVLAPAGAAFLLLACLMDADQHAHGQPVPVRHWHIHTGPHEHVDAHGHVHRHSHLHVHPVPDPHGFALSDHHPHGDHTTHAHDGPGRGPALPPVAA
jgi:hypothetical protein